MAEKRKKSNNTGKPDAAFREFKDIEADYRFDPSIFAKDEERVAAIKYIIDNKLSRVDKTLILIYADCLSSRKMGQRLGFSHITIQKEIRRIKSIIMEEYKQMIAVWKPIPGYDRYEVSDQGGVRSSDRLVTMTIRGTECQSLRRGRTLKPAKDNCGYLNVRLSKYGKSRSFYVHRLVAAAFIPNPDKLPQVNHKDEDKTNNVAKNLEWCTAKRNSSYGTRPARLQTRVAKYTVDGELLQVYDSVKAAAVDTGCHYTSITHCCKGDVKTVRGFVWKYIEEDATTRISADGGQQCM